MKEANNKKKGDRERREKPMLVFWRKKSPAGLLFSSFLRYYNDEGSD